MYSTVFIYVFKHLPPLLVSESTLTAEWNNELASSKHVSPRCLRSIWDFLAQQCSVICVALLNYFHRSPSSTPTFSFLLLRGKFLLHQPHFCELLSSRVVVCHSPTSLCCLFPINSTQSSPTYMINKITSHLILKCLWNPLAFPHWQTTEKFICRSHFPLHPLPFILKPRVSTINIQLHQRGPGKPQERILYRERVVEVLRFFFSYKGLFLNSRRTKLLVRLFSRMASAMSLREMIFWHMTLVHQLPLLAPLN